MSDLEKMREKYQDDYNETADTIYQGLRYLVHEEVKAMMGRLIDAEKNIEKLQEKCEVNRALIKEGYIENFKKVIKDCVNKNK